MEASRRQPGMLQGLSRFLVQHERCGAGFDVAHPAGLGSGRVSITCRGCGARHEYATATIEVERELTIEPAEAPARPQPPPRRTPPPIPPRPAPYPESADQPAAAGPAIDRTAARTGRTQAAGPAGGARRGVGAPPAAGSASGTRRHAGAAASATAGTAAPQPRTAAPPREPGALGALRSFWRSPRATLTLLLVAAAALGFGVVRLVNGGGSKNQETQPAPSPPATSISPPTPVPSGRTGPPTPPTAQPSTTTLRTERFTLQVPKGWTERTSIGGLLLQPRGGGRVNVQVFFQRSPGLSLSTMAGQTSRFLRREVPGASLFPNKVLIGGLPAYEITARGPGETAIAVDILHNPYRYLVVRRIFAGAKPDTSQAAGRIVSSFKPR